MSVGLGRWSRLMGLAARSLVLLAAITVTVSQVNPYPPLTESMFMFLMDGINHGFQEPRDQQTILPEYDFIIVGAGSAGCVVANRLTENPRWKVLLIEAGDAESYLMDIPILANMLQFTNANWKYKSTPNNRSCLGLENKQCNLPRGKVMGGSSVLNYMIMTRGNKKDYDAWEAAGNKGWGYDSVLKYFKKMEDIDIEELKSDKKYHSTGGYMTISHPPTRTPVGEAFVQGGVEMGYKNVDYNGENQVGFSFHQASMKNGTRWSTSRAYLHPIKARRNLHVKKSSQVTRILIEPKSKRAYGVEFIQRRRKYIVKARMEVILSAGAVNSPQLLMLSGIGPEEHLNKFKIPVVQDLPVGYNLQDHVALGGLTFMINDSVSINVDRIVGDPVALNNFARYHTGFASIPGGTEALAFFDTNDLKNHAGWPDLELLFIAGTLTSEPTLRKNFGLTDEVYNAVYKPMEGQDGYMIFVMIMRPKSRGRVMLRSANPLKSPLIDMGYFSDPSDLDVAVKGVELSMQLSNTPAMRKLNSQPNPNKIPGCRQFDISSAEYSKCQARHLSFTIYHQSGTCKMGPDSDPAAVLDDRLRVKGIKGLRVIDASIMPTIPAAHTNYPTIMIGEKGSDMIKEDYSFI